MLVNPIKEAGSVGVRGYKSTQGCWIPDIGLDNALNRTECLLTSRRHLSAVKEDVIDEVGAT